MATAVSTTEQPEAPKSTQVNGPQTKEPARPSNPSGAGPDYHYFGPPVPGRAKSPYWPADGLVPWNPVDAQRTLPGLLTSLGNTVANGPYRALPKSLTCACPPPHCLLPILDKYCEVHRIPRTTARRPSTIPAADLRYVLLATRILDNSDNHVSVAPGSMIPSPEKSTLRVAGPRLFVAAGATAVYAALEAYRCCPNPDGILRTSWGVADLDALASAVSTEGSELWEALVSALLRNI
jgi:hypothetical protein